MTDLPSGNSRAISSNQPGVHDKLEAVVTRHLSSTFQKPYAAHTLDAFAELDALVQQHAGPVVLDACCGVGESTAALAKMHPNALVIGVDKSAHRLDRFDGLAAVQAGANALVLRADLNDLWRLIATANWPLSHQYLLYPNPWPKAAHLKRRWHGAPVFPAILACGGRLELRSNWRLYVEEFALALKLAGVSARVEPYRGSQAITPFERKYWASGQQSWRLVCRLS